MHKYFLSTNFQITQLQVVEKNKLQLITIIYVTGQ